MNDERVTMLFQCLLDHTPQKLYFCLISLLRNNVSKRVYINLRQSVYTRTAQTTVRGPSRTRQRLLYGLPQPNDFTVIFVV